MHQAYPALSLVESSAPRQSAPKNQADLTYLADAGLVTGTELPPTLLADMARRAAWRWRRPARADAGARQRLQRARRSAVGRRRLAGAAAHWGLTLPSGAVGGAMPGYRDLPC